VDGVRVAVKKDGGLPQCCDRPFRVSKKRLLGSPLAGELSPPKAVTEGGNVVENKNFSPLTPSDLTSFGHLPRKGGGFK